MSRVTERVSLIMGDGYDWYYGTVGPATEDDSICMPLLNGTHLSDGRIPVVLGIGSGILTVCVYVQFGCCTLFLQEVYGWQSLYISLHM